MLILENGGDVYVIKNNSFVFKSNIQRLNIAMGK